MFITMKVALILLIRMTVVMWLEENAFILPFFQVFIMQIENTLNSGCVTEFILKAGFSCMEVKCIQKMSKMT